jgi:hypothetical protein
LKKDGAVCAGTVECESGVCGGRCCPLDSPTCACAQPSVGNLVKNAGFDGDLSGWAIEPNDGEVTWLPSDATDCPFSGSVKLSVPPITNARSPRISQCVAAIERNLHFQFHAKCLPYGVVECGADVFSEKNCVGLATTHSIDWFNQTWGVDREDVESPVGGSVRLRCELVPNPLQTGAAIVDMIGLTPPPDDY